MSSSPVTARSSGTRRPRRRAAFMAPAAITSFPPKMAVGRSCRDSSSRQASAALSTVGSHSLMCRVSAGR
ncbi:DUF465 domain-containing protein, partial [Dysosmobacter welbionis]